MKKISRSDWVGLRALYLLIATDASAACSHEVQRIVNYYERKYTNKVVGSAMSAIAKDNTWRGTFEAPDVMFARRLDRSIHITWKDSDNKEAIIDVTKGLQ